MSEVVLVRKNYVIIVVDGDLQVLHFSPFMAYRKYFSDKNHFIANNKFFSSVQSIEVPEAYGFVKYLFLLAICFFNI